MHEDDLATHREALASLDARILELIAQRQARSLEIGRLKAAMGRGTRDFTRERVVIQGARARAEGLGLDPALAERLVELLIEASLSVQEQDRITTTTSGDGLRAWVIGGAGRMGRWFTALLAAQGWDVGVVDPGGVVDGLRHAPTLDGADVASADLILVATPLDRTAEALSALRAHRPQGVVVDIASIKTPVIPALRALSDDGVAVTSLHPMFGPSTSLLSGKHVLVSDVGHPEATSRARALFEPTMAALVDVPLEEHDLLVSWILNASHAVSLVFGRALSEAPVARERLDGLGSTTFDAQCAVTGKVLSEDPSLYHAIQAFNPHAPNVFDALERALSIVRDASAEDGKPRFEALMAAGRAYLG